MRLSIARFILLLNMTILQYVVKYVLTNTIYSDIMDYMKDRKVNIVVDATKDLLMNVLQYHPFMIKPNISWYTII